MCKRCFNDGDQRRAVCGSGPLSFRNVWKSIFFWHVNTCSLVNDYRRWKENLFNPDDWGSGFLKNSFANCTKWKAAHPRRQWPQYGNSTPCCSQWTIIKVSKFHNLDVSFSEFDFRLRTSWHIYVARTTEPCPADAISRDLTYRPAYTSVWCKSTNIAAFVIAQMDKWWEPLHCKPSDMRGTVLSLSRANNCHRQLWVSSVDWLYFASARIQIPLVCWTVHRADNGLHVHHSQWRPHTSAVCWCH